MPDRSANALTAYLAFARNTVKKPFMVIRKTPAKKRKSVASPNAEEIGLNTTFTLESDDESENDDIMVKKIEQRIPQMNDIEKAVVEESLKEMIERAKNVSRIFFSYPLARMFGL